MKVTAERAREAELQYRAKAEKETVECRLRLWLFSPEMPLFEPFCLRKYAELGAQRQKEMQVAVLKMI